MTSRKAILLAAVLAVLVLGSGFYLYSRSSPTNSVEVHIMIVGDGTDFYSPSNVNVRQGQQVTLAVFNSDDNSHGLVIPDLNVDSGIIKGATTTRMTFTADTVGTFMFYSPASYCQGGIGNVCNSVQALKGYLTVTP